MSKATRYCSFALAVFAVATSCGKSNREHGPADRPVTGSGGGGSSCVPVEAGAAGAGEVGGQTASPSIAEVDSDDSERDPTSGTRLRAVVRDGGDGLLVFHHWRDTELGIECQFARAYDGAMRCLPWPATRTIEFSDERCTEAFVRELACRSTPYFVGDYADPDCDSIPEITPYQRGDAFTGAVYSPSGSGVCQEGEVLAGHRLGVASPELFAEAEFFNEPLSDALAVRSLRTSDGASQRFFMVGSARGTACVARGMASGEERCIDADAAEVSGSWYAEPGCSGDRAVLSAGDCPPPALAFVRGPVAACTTSPIASIHEIGEPVERVSTRTSCGCESQESLLFRRLGRELDPASFPELSRVRIGPARMKLEYLATPSSEPLVRSGIWDSQRSEYCGLYPTTSGIRCLPGGLLRENGVHGEYADSDCTEPLFSEFDCGLHAGAIVNLTSSDPFGECPWEVVGLETLTARHSGRVYAPDASGACVETTARAGNAYFLLDSGPSLDDFPLWTEREL